MCSRVFAHKKLLFVQVAENRVFAKPETHIYGLPTTNISPEVINMIGMTWYFAEKPQVESHKYECGPDAQDILIRLANDPELI